MVESSELIIGVLNNVDGGTSSTIDCAVRNSRILKIIATSDIAEKFLWTRDVQHIPL